MRKFRRPIPRHPPLYETTNKLTGKEFRTKCDNHTPKEYRK
jgi:hypothetical protein